MVRRAVELLQFNPRGYLLIVDAGLIRHAQRQNNGERTLAEILELDRAVAVAREYAGGKSLILVAGDCAIGGLKLNGFPFRKDSGVAILGIGSNGFPWLSWATGPHGIKRYPVTNPPVPNESDASRQSSDLQTATEPGAIYSPQALNAVGDVILFGVGPGAQQISGTMDNTDVFRIVRDNL
jgi:alkaline phosphatase